MVFTSPHELTGTPNADHQNELFRWNRAANTFDRLTDSPAGVSFPVVDSTGSRVAFISNGDFAGTNADGSVEVFLYDRLGGSYVQVSNSATAGSSSGSLVMNDQATVFAFTSNADLLGTNGDENREIFLCIGSPAAADVPTLGPVGLALLGLLLAFVASRLLPRT